ncbi:MAG: hypothetical protein ACSLFQ_15760 [Thermoanaerobaculia bacterium]
MPLAKNETSRITEVARQIIGVIPTEVEIRSEDARVIRYRVRRGFGWRLSTVVLDKLSLLRLANDPQRDIKIEYLRRELVDSATERREFRYPRTLAVGG